MTAAIAAIGSARTARAAPAQQTSMRRLTALLNPCSGDVVDVDQRQAVEFLEPCAQRDELQESGHHLDVDALAVRHFDQAEHGHVPFERQGHVQLVDPLAGHHVPRVGQRAQQRQAAVAHVVAAGDLVVEESHDVVPELGVPQAPVGDVACELAGAGDEHAPEPDACREPPAHVAPHDRSREE